MSQTFVDKLTVNLELLRCAELMDKCGIRLDIDKIKGRSRGKDIIFHRALVVFILTKKGYSCTEQGFMLDRDHSTILHAQKYSKYKSGRDDRYPFVCDALAAEMENSPSGATEENVKILREIMLYEQQILILKKQLIPPQ